MSPDALPIDEAGSGIKVTEPVEEPPDLPTGWGSAPLGEVLPLEYGKALPERLRDSTGKVAVYGSSGLVGRHTAAIVSGPILIVGRKGSAGAVFYCDEDCWPIDTVYFAKARSVVDLRYGFYFLKWKGLVQFDQSTAIPSLSRDVYSDVTILIAPLPEQRRIVARINELFAEIAEGEAALQRVRQGLDTWRRAMLKAAVTGELTRDWREANRPAETGANLLARIRAGYEASVTRRVRGRRAAVTGPLDTSALPELPEGWEWARLDALGEIVGGVTVDKKRAPADPVEVPYLRVANVQRGYLDLTEVKTIRVERNVARRLELKPNDVLLNEGGDRDKIGRGWIWQDEFPICIHQNHVFRVRLHDDGINAQFVSHYANELGRGFFIEKGKQTTNLASISLSKISELPIPVPPPAEAQIIVERLHASPPPRAERERLLPMRITIET